MNKFNTGDKVFVISWGKHYSEFYKWKDNIKEQVFPWKTEIPDYSGIEHHWKYEYKPKLTLKGVPFKSGEKELVSKTPVYKDYKYEVLEVMLHPSAGEYTQTEEVRAKWKDMDDRYTTKPIYLLASTHTDKDWMRCYIQIEEGGLSLLTPQQFADEKFNAMLEHYKTNKLTPEIVLANQRDISKVFSKDLIKSVYDTNDNVLFGSAYVKGKVHYDYVPAEFMATGNSYIICVGINYDGKGNADLPEGSLLVPFHELHKMFPDNEFRG